MPILRPFLMGLAMAAGASFVVKHAMSTDTEFLTNQLSDLLQNATITKSVHGSNNATPSPSKAIVDNEQKAIPDVSQVSRYVYAEWNKIKFERWNPLIRDLGRKLMPPPQ